MAIVVKRRGKQEKFDERKAYASVYSACMECDLGERESEKIAERLTVVLKKHFQDRKQINSTEIFGYIIERLAKEHEAVAFMYQTHRDIV